MILSFLGLPLLLSILPMKITNSKLWLQCVTWYAFFIFSLFLLLLIGDTIYFGQVHRHVGHELSAIIQTDAYLMITMAFQAYIIQLILFAVLVFITFLLWRKVFHATHPPATKVHLQWHVRLPLIICILALMILGIRGSIISKPITAVFAFESGNMAQGHLTLNGVFSTVHALTKVSSNTIDILAFDKAKSTVQSILNSTHESYPNNDFPLMRHRDSPIQPYKKNPNIVILLLESWGSEHVDITREILGKEPFHVTPNFNELAKNGILFTNFYANGQRSIEAISSILAGIPHIPGTSSMGEGVETNNLGWLGHIAKKQGYQTYLLQGSKRASLYLDRIAPLAGFDTYDGAQDFKESQHKGVTPPTWGVGWDHDLFTKANQRFEQATPPFLGLVFTVSTHIPYDLPSDKTQWKKFPGETPQERYLNSLFYADWALGQFMDKAKQAPYFEHTIFILTADHVSGLGEGKEISSQHHVPLLIFGPGITPRKSAQLGSHLDLIPTIIDLAGWSSNYASMGQSLLESSPNKGVLFMRGDLVGRIEDDAVLLHNLNRTVYYSGVVNHEKSVEHRLLASIQLVSTLLQKNRVHP
ncbi:MAG: LTA synthase family protein [Mariprofundaceae bacterium]